MGKWTKEQRQRFNESLIKRGLNPRTGRRKKAAVALAKVTKKQTTHLPLEAIPDKVKIKVIKRRYSLPRTKNKLDFTPGQASGVASKPRSKIGAIMSKVLAGLIIEVAVQISKELEGGGEGWS